jgi:hypothetical protein
MGGYLDTYGAGVERRITIMRRLAIWTLAILAATGIVVFTFRIVIPNRAEQTEVSRFFNLLGARQYKQAYAMWGCTDATPCRDYSFAAFMGDWGPEAVPISTFAVLDGESCGSGVIVDVDSGKAGDKKLWVERQSRTLGFLPPGPGRCPKGNRVYDFFRDLRYRLRGRTYQ